MPRAPDAQRLMQVEEARMAYGHEGKGHTRAAIVIAIMAAALALIDACVRLLPGVMGKPASGADESFSEGLLEYPQYTRPQEFEGLPIPDILLSGDHARVAAWRRAEALSLTKARRPDLWAIKSRQKPPKNTTDG